MFEHHICVVLCRRRIRFIHLFVVEDKWLFFVVEVSFNFINNLVRGKERYENDQKTFPQKDLSFFYLLTPSYFYPIEFPFVEVTGSFSISLLPSRNEICEIHLGDLLLSVPFVYTVHFSRWLFVFN